MFSLVTSLESGFVPAEWVVLRFWMSWMFYQIWVRGVLAENPEHLFYPNIDLGESYSGFEITSHQLDQPMHFLNAYDQNDDGLDELFMAQQDYFPVPNPSATIALRYGQPASLNEKVISSAQAGDETLQGSFGALYGFCWTMAPLSGSDHAPDFVYAQRSPVADGGYNRFINIRFSNQGNGSSAFNSAGEDLSIVSDSLNGGCPMTTGALGQEGLEIIMAMWDSGSVNTVRGPFAGQMGSLFANFAQGGDDRSVGSMETVRSVRLDQWGSPHGLPYPIQYAEWGGGLGALLVSRYDTPQAGNSFVGEVDILKSSQRFTGVGGGGRFSMGNSAWDVTIRCTSDPGNTQRCGQALALGPVIQDHTGMAVSWLNRDGGGLFVGVIYDLPQLLATYNGEPIVLEDSLDGVRGFRIVGSALTVSVPTGLSLDITHLRGQALSEVFLRVPSNPTGVFVLFPDQFNSSSVDLDQLDGYRGFTIKGKTHAAPNQTPWTESVGESAAFLRMSDPDCQDIVLSNRVPSNYVSRISGENPVGYVLYGRDLGRLAGPSAAPSASLSPSRSPSSPASASASISTSVQEPSVSVSPSTLLAILSASRDAAWHDQPKYIVPMAVGGAFILALGVFVKKCVVVSRTPASKVPTLNAYFPPNESDADFPGNSSREVTVIVDTSSSNSSFRSVPSEKAASEVREAPVTLAPEILSVAEPEPEQPNTSKEVAVNPHVLMPAPKNPAVEALRSRSTTLVERPVEQPSDKPTYKPASHSIA